MRAAPVCTYLPGRLCVRVVAYARALQYIMKGCRGERESDCQSEREGEIATGGEGEAER